MSPDTNAYVAIPMEGMIMTSSAPSARRRSSSNSKVWILGGLIAVVLLLLGIPILMRRARHGCHDTMEQQMYSSDTVVMVIKEPVEDFLMEEPKIERYNGKPFVLKEDEGEIVETNETDDGQVADDDYENEEELEDANEIIGDYENEIDAEFIKYEEGPNEGPHYNDEADQGDNGVIVIDYVEELDDEESIVDDAVYDISTYEEVPNEFIDDWYDAVEERQDTVSFDELEELFEELTEEDVVKVESMGGN
jgi:hypothetical protein